MEKEEVQISVKLDFEKRKAFNAYAKEIGINPGSLIRSFIYSTIEQHKEKMSHK